MKTDLEAAITAMAKKATNADNSTAAQQFAQAALNLAHALASVEGIAKQS